MQERFVNKIEGLVYNTYMRSAMSCEAECWPIKINDIRKMKSTQMRMLWIICEKAMNDKVKKLILQMTGVKPLKKFLKNQRLRWFGHIERMSKEKAPAMEFRTTGCNPTSHSLTNCKVI